MNRLLPLIALLLSSDSLAWCARSLTAVNLTVGQNLAGTGHVTLSEAAPPGGLRITITSGNPNLMSLSANPESAGTAAIVVTVQDGLRGSPDFYVYGLGNSGTASYLASAPEYGNCSGTVTLAPSGIVMQGTYGLGNPVLMTTGADASKIVLHSAVTDSSGQFVALQPVAGGPPVAVNVVNSEPHVGTIIPSSVTIPAGSASATLKFKPSSAGKTTLVARARGFTASPQHGTLAITVLTPGISITDQVAIGRDLQLGGTLTLGQPAPPTGLRVMLTSNNPKALLLSHTAQEVGLESITIDVPGGATNGLFHLQSLSDSGTATYTVIASGYVSRTGTVNLTPSGVVIGLGPPDEAEVFRKEAAEEPHGLSVSLSKGPSFPLTVYMVQLDPVTHRGADITVQALRRGASVTVELMSSDPTVGTIGSPVSIGSGISSGVMPFIARKAGTTVISAATPAGFTPAKNSTSLTVVVRP
jgi:hypothetical protein